MGGGVELSLGAVLLGLLGGDLFFVFSLCGPGVSQLGSDPFNFVFNLACAGCGGIA